MSIILTAHHAEMHQDALPALGGTTANDVCVWDAAGSAGVPPLCPGELFLAVSFCKVTVPAHWDVKLGKTNKWTKRN